jgi:hypothetical protein
MTSSKKGSQDVAVTGTTLMLSGMLTPQKVVKPSIRASEIKNHLARRNSSNFSHEMKAVKLLITVNRL